MIENKRILIVCSVITVISIILIRIFNRDWSASFWINILVSISTNSILSAIISSISFNHQKQETIFKLKESIKKEIEKYLSVFYSIEYIYFNDKLHNELIALNMYEENRTWYNSFITSNKTLLKSNIKKLKSIKTINFTKFQADIDKLSKFNKKILIPEYYNFISQIKDIDNLIKYFEIKPLEANIPNVYKKIQNIIFECQNENNKKISDDIRIKKR